MSRLKAALLLALSFLKTVVLRLFGAGRVGVEAFRENYAADGLSRVSPEQRAAMEEFGRCIACGLCDRGEAERMQRSAGAYAGVMQLMLAASRSMPDYAAAARSFAFVPEEVLADKEHICPTRVPMVKIARFVKEKALEARGSMAAKGANPSA